MIVYSGGHTNDFPGEPAPIQNWRDRLAVHPEIRMSRVADPTTWDYECEVIDIDPESKSLRAWEEPC